MSTTVEVEVEVNIRPTVSRPVCLGVGHPSGTRNQFFFPLKIFFRLLRICYFVAPSLRRGRVCNLLGLAKAVTLGSHSAEFAAIFCCLIWDSPNLEGQVPVFISPRNRVAKLYPRALGLSTINSTRLELGQSLASSGGWSVIILLGYDTAVTHLRFPTHLIQPSPILVIIVLEWYGSCLVLGHPCLLHFPTFHVSFNVEHFVSPNISSRHSSL
jgi:hypothetical protein